MSKPATAENLFDGITRFISDSRALLARGAVMELAGLDDHVRSLCEQVVNMSQEERLRHADKLQLLLDELKHLGDELVEQRELVAKEMKGATQHRKASVAYNVADSRDDYGKKDG